MEFCQYVFEPMRMFIVISVVMVQWFGVIASLKWIWKNWYIIVVIVTWNVIASLGWIRKGRFSYMVETPGPLSEDNQELVDVIETPEPISEDNQELVDVIETPEPISEDNQEPVDVDASASLPSSSASRWKHDVFLSFRGADTRKGIASEIYYRLQYRTGIKTFMDDQDLQVGDVISPTLLTAIKESRFAIIVLSPNYASSTWCLEELRNICECMEEDNNRILPLFYYVDPTDVRYQKSSFGDAFTKHENSGRHRSEKVQQWRAALKKVANFSGWHTLNYKTERELLDAIEESLCNKL